MMPARAPLIKMSLYIFIGLVWLSFRFLNSYHLVPCFPSPAVAEMLGEGDEVVVGVVALSFLRKKAFMSLNSAAWELFETTLAPEASSSIVR